MRVESCSSCPPTPPSAAFAGAVRSSSFDIMVTTADGDRVTLSAEQTSSIAGVATSDGGRAGTSASESSFSLTVEGSLDKGEIRDLRKVLKLLAKAGADQDSSRVAKRLSRPDMDTIAGVEASFSKSVAVIGGVLLLAPAPPEIPAEEAA